MKYQQSNKANQFLAASCCGLITVTFTVVFFALFIDSLPPV